MSIYLQNMIWRIAFPTHAQKLIALKLADWAADDGGSVFPGRNTIAERCDVSVPTVKRTMAAFREAGILHLTREGGDGPGDTNEWRVNVPLIEALAANRARLEGDSGVVGIVWAGEGEEGQDEPHKGGQGDPLIYPHGGHPEQLRGSPTTKKGVTSDPQSVTINQVSVSARAGACDGDAAPARAQAPPAAARRALLIQRDDPSWSDWLSCMTPREREAAEAAGEFMATHRWPSAEAAIVELAKLPQISEEPKQSITARMIGEREP